MFDNPTFQKLVEADNLTGEVVDQKDVESIEFAVNGKSYTVEREAKPATAYPIVKVQGVRQTGPRLLPPAMLGMPREGWKRYSEPGTKDVPKRP